MFRAKMIGSATVELMFVAGTVDAMGVMVAHPTKRHNEEWTQSCPSGYQGTVGLSCYTKQVMYKQGSGTCTRICPATEVYSGGDPLSGVPLRVEQLSDTRTITKQCPSSHGGSQYIGSVTVTCSEGTSNISRGSCIKMTCAQQTTTVSGLQITLPQTDNGEMASVLCPLGYKGGYITAACTNGDFVNVQGACAAESSSEFGTEEKGICIAANGTSPPNYSTSIDKYPGLSKAVCQDECKYTSECQGYSYSEDMGRCALWVNKRIGECPEKAGFSKHPGAGWSTGDSLKEGNKDEAGGWKCVIKKVPAAMDSTYTHSGAGICTKKDGSNYVYPSNYSKNYNPNMDQEDFCKQECEATPHCQGFSLMMEGIKTKRCAIWVDTKNLVAKPGWDKPYEHHGDWDFGNDYITGGDGKDSKWTCYKRFTIVPGTSLAMEYEYKDFESS
eukprot:UN25040